jgi:hypothetical protein
MEVKLDNAGSSVSCLKQSIHTGHGIPAFRQQLFLLSKSGDKKAKANVEAKQGPMRDADLLWIGCCVALCIDAAAEGSYWGSSCGSVR